MLPVISLPSVARSVSDGTLCSGRLSCWVSLQAPQSGRSGPRLGRVLGAGLRPIRATPAIYALSTVDHPDIAPYNCHLTIVNLPHASSSAANVAFEAKQCNGEADIKVLVEYRYGTLIANV